MKQPTKRYVRVIVSSSNARDDYMMEEQYAKDLYAKGLIRMITVYQRPDYYDPEGKYKRRQEKK